MYKVYSDDNLIYDTRLSDYRLLNPKLELELNKTGSFDFTIYPHHPNFNKIEKLKSIITIYQDEDIIFRGRVLNSEKGFNNELKVDCEGELAFLLDSIQRPYEFTGTPEELFKKFIESHNSQVEESHRFKIGNITVTDPNNYINRSDTTYLTTWDSINKKLIELLGGYIFVRHETDGNYIDYVEDFDKLNPQKIELGKNLLDLKTIVKGEDIATAIIPLGAKYKVGEGEEEREYRLTISDVNEGKDYISNQDAVNKFGWIFKTITWDDVTEPTNLLRKGNEELSRAFLYEQSIEVNAVDLAGTDKTISNFKLGTYNHIESSIHSLTDKFLVTKLSINLSNPAADKLTLGVTFQSLTEQNKDDDITDIVEDIVKDTMGNAMDGVLDGAVAELEKQLQSLIQQSADKIMTEVSEKYYLKDDAKTLIESISTQFEQTKDEFNFIFKGFQQDLNDVISGTDAQFKEWEKYIRFVNGTIVLGEVGNQLELTIENDRISFKQNNFEVAYFSNNKLFVTDGEFLNSLILGKFAFKPRKNGNLSFVKIKK